MQDAAGNIFVDRNGIWIRRHSHHSVINILVGIFVVFQVVFRPAAYCGASQFVHSPVSGQSP